MFWICERVAESLSESIVYECKDRMGKRGCRNDSAKSQFFSELQILTDHLLMLYHESI